MIKNVDYDSEVDAISVEISPKKANVTCELTEHILVDVGSDQKIVSIEILDASEEISKLFGRIVSKKEIQQMLCSIKQEPNNEFLVTFQSPQKNERANLLITLYKSPILA